MATINVPVYQLYICLRLSQAALCLVIICHILNNRHLRRFCDWDPLGATW